MTTNQFDHQETYQCRNGAEVTIGIDDETFVASVLTPDGKPIGRLEFNYDDRLNSLKLCWAYLDLLDNTYVHQGIGRKILQIMIDRFDYPITAEPDDGQTTSDGSHLTGNAPSFVAKMREEGLIAEARPDTLTDTPDDTW